MKLYKFLICIAAVFGVLYLTSCDEDEFLDNNGNTDAKNLNVTLDGYFAFDAPDQKLATLTFNQGSEGQVGQAATETRFNDGDWKEAGSFDINIPGEAQLSLNDFLEIHGLSFEEVTASDFAEFSWILDDEFRGGITTVPIICSTDIVLSNDTIVLYHATDSLVGVIPFDLEVEGPADIKTVDILVTLNDDEEPVILKSLEEWPTTENITLADVVNALNLKQDSLALEDVITFNYQLNSEVTCVSESSIVTTYDCISDLSGEYAYKTTANFCNADTILMDTMALISTGKRTYTFEDFSFGTYTLCYRLPADQWNWGSLQFTDVCNDVSIDGSDEFEDMGWKLAVENVSGSVLTLSWTNDFGEFATVEITSIDGTDWPPLY